jgi:hypothetical protein
VTEAELAGLAEAIEEEIADDSSLKVANSVSQRLRKYASLKDGRQSREFFEQFASWLAARKQHPTKAARRELARSNHSMDRGEGA